MEEFAREMSTPYFLSQGKTEIPSHGDELVIGHISKSLAAKDKEFYFHEITDHPGFHRAILATLKDLKDACLSPEQMDKILRDTKIAGEVHLRKLKDLLSLWKAYEKRLQDLKWYDGSDVMTSASQLVSDSIYLKKTPTMIIYGFYDFNIVQKRLLQACLKEKGAIIYIPYEPTHAFEYVKPALKWLKDNGFKETSAQIPETKKRIQPLGHLCRHLFDDGKPAEIPPDVIQIISAPGEQREAREVMREIIRASREMGIAFHEIGVLLRAPSSIPSYFGRRSMS
jgi:ATP-dependent helicase/DNAse subunit B